MNKGFWSTLPFLALLILAFGAPTSAQTGQILDNTYYPGYVAYALPLAWLVQPDLRPACAALQRNDLETAEKAFRSGIARHPEDLAAYVGLLQAMRGVRDTYLTDYQQDVKAEDTAANEFKLGVLAWYMFGERMPDYRPQAQKEKRRLAKVSRDALERAYDLSHAPVVGFTLADAEVLGGPRASVVIYEDMLKRMGGTRVYNAYISATRNGWRARQPPVPNMAPPDLLIFRRIITGLKSVNSGRGAVEVRHVVNGKETVTLREEPYSSVQQRAMAYLSTWAERIKEAAGRRSS